MRFRVVEEARLPSPRKTVCVCVYIYIYIYISYDLLARDDSAGTGAPARAPMQARGGPVLYLTRRPHRAGGASSGAGSPPPPPSRTKWTRRVPHPVLIGHATCRRSQQRRWPTPTWLSRRVPRAGAAARRRLCMPRALCLGSAEPRACLRAPNRRPNVAIGAQRFGRGAGPRHRGHHPQRVHG